jgi:hypothetical protein
MPKFLYTVTFFTIGFWAAVAFVIYRLPPATFLNILILLVLLFFALSLSLSLLLFAYYSKRLPPKTDSHVLYKKNLKWGLFISFGIIGFMTLRAFTLVNIFTGGLFLLFYVALYFQFKNPR